MAREQSSTRRTEQSSLFETDDDTNPDSEATITITHVEDPQGYDHYGGRVERGGMDERPPGKKGWLGNPYTVAKYGREQCIKKFRHTFLATLRSDRRFANAVYGLKGSVVACHCRYRTEDEPKCHLDVVRKALLNGVVVRSCYHHGITIEQADVAAHIPEEMRGDDE